MPAALFNLDSRGITSDAREALSTNRASYYKVIFKDSTGASGPHFGCKCNIQITDKITQSAYGERGYQVRCVIALPVPVYNMLRGQNLEGKMDGADSIAIDEVPHVMFSVFLPDTTVVQVRRTGMKPESKTLRSVVDSGLTGTYGGRIVGMAKNRIKNGYVEVNPAITIISLYYSTEPFGITKLDVEDLAAALSQIEEEDRTTADDDLAEKFSTLNVSSSVSIGGAKPMGPLMDVERLLGTGAKVHDVRGSHSQAPGGSGSASTTRGAYNLDKPADVRSQVTRGISDVFSGSASGNATSSPVEVPSSGLGKSAFPGQAGDRTSAASMAEVPMDSVGGGVQVAQASQPAQYPPTSARTRTPEPNARSQIQYSSSPRQQGMRSDSQTGASGGSPSGQYNQSPMPPPGSVGASRGSQAPDTPRMTPRGHQQTPSLPTKPR